MPFTQKRANLSVPPLPVALRLHQQLMDWRDTLLRRYGEDAEQVFLDELLEKYINRPTREAAEKTVRQHYGRRGLRRNHRRKLRYYDLSIREECHAFAKAKYGPGYDPEQADALWRRKSKQRG